MIISINEITVTIPRTVPSITILISIIIIIIIFLFKCYFIRPGYKFKTKDIPSPAEL